MKFECVHDCIYNDRCVNVGDIVEMDEKSPDAKRKCFKPLEVAEATDDDDKPRYNELGQQQITKASLQRKLEELGVPFRARDKYETLLAKFKEATSPKF